MAYQYKAVPFTASVGGTSRKDAEAAAAQLTSAINAQATEGWELYQVESVTVMISPGCLGALTGARPTPSRLDQLIFRREKGA